MGRNLTFLVEGQSVTLVNGLSETSAAPGSAAGIVTRYLGQEASGDLDGDGRADAAFLITQSRGGSGTFFYVVVALATPGGHTGTNALLLGAAADTSRPAAARARQAVGHPAARAETASRRTSQPLFRRILSRR